MNFKLIFFLPLFLAVVCHTGNLDSAGVMSLKVWDDHIYALTADRLYRSIDSGKTWDTISNKNVCADSLPDYLQRLFVINIRNDTVFLGTGCGIFRSSVNNIQWEPFSVGLPDIPQRRIMIIEFINDKILAGGRDTAPLDGIPDNGLFEYNIDSLRWVSRNNGLPKDKDLTVGEIFQADSLVYACVNGGVYYSENYGSSWNHIDSVHAYHLAYANNTLFAASGYGGVFRTEDGQNWVTVDSGHRELSYAILHDIYADSSAVMYNKGSHIFVSRDNGASWTENITDFLIQTFARFGDFMVAGTYSGVIFSDDYFKTYARFAGGPAGIKSNKTLNDVFDIEYLKEKKSISIKIFSNTRHEVAVIDLNGKPIKEYRGNSDANYVIRNIHDPGVYVLILKLGKRKIVKRIVVF